MRAVDLQTVQAPFLDPPRRRRHTRRSSRRSWPWSWEPAPSTPSGWARRSPTTSAHRGGCFGSASGQGATSVETASCRGGETASASFSYPHMTSSLNRGIVRFRLAFGWTTDGLEETHPHAAPGSRFVVGDQAPSTGLQGLGTEDGYRGRCGRSGSGSCTPRS